MNTNRTEDPRKIWAEDAKRLADRREGDIANLSRRAPDAVRTTAEMYREEHGQRNNASNDEKYGVEKEGRAEEILMHAVMKHQMMEAGTTNLVQAASDVKKIKLPASTTSFAKSSDAMASLVASTSLTVTSDHQQPNVLTMKKKRENASFNDVSSGKHRMPDSIELVSLETPLDKPLVPGKPKTFADGAGQTFTPMGGLELGTPFNAHAKPGKKPHTPDLYQDITVPSIAAFKMQTLDDAPKPSML